MPRRRRLVTLEDAGKYITRLPKAEHEAQEWQAAMEALILVATSGGPTMFARIGIMRALNRGVERGCSTPIARIIFGESGSWRVIDDRAKGARGSSAHKKKAAAGLRSAAAFFCEGPPGD